MKFFSNVKKTAQRATYFQGLKEETLLIKDSAQSLIDNVKEVTQQEKTASQSTKKFSELDPEDIAYSSKIYVRLLGIFIFLDIMGLVYLIYTLARHDWFSSFSVFVFLIICGALTFRFHFLLTVIREKNLQLSLVNYFELLFNLKSKKQNKDAATK